MESILARNFPAPTSFSAADVLVAIRSIEKLSISEFQDNLIYKYMKSLLEAEKLTITGSSKQGKQNKEALVYSITPLCNKSKQTITWFDNELGIYLQEVFTNFGKKERN